MILCSYSISRFIGYLAFIDITYYHMHATLLVLLIHM